MLTDTKTALLDAAETAARTRGFDGFSYADLSRAVGIRKASIHHHFPTKAALSLALMRRYCEAFEAACSEIEETHSSGAARISALINRYEAALKGGKSLCLCVSFSTSRDSLPSEVLVEIRAFREARIRWLTRAFEQAEGERSIADLHDPQAEATALLALLEGAQLAARSAEEPQLFRNALALFNRRVIPL